jgi:hypothetical protein
MREGLTPFPNAVTGLEWGSANRKDIKQKWFLLFGAVAFVVNTGWFVSELVGLKTSSDGVLAQPLTIRI